MWRDLRAGFFALLILTLALGFAYPLAVMLSGQAMFGHQAEGSLASAGGRTVGSELIGQDFGDDDSYFQSRPSVTGYSADVTFFGNLGPNSRKLTRQLERRVRQYLDRERPFTPGLVAGEVPPDAVMASASGVDPHISVANAEIQANRVAQARGLSVDRVLELVDENTSGRGLGFLGEPGVDVLQLNLALDEGEER